MHCSFKNATPLIHNYFRQGCRVGVPGVWILAEGRSRRPNFLNPGVEFLPKMDSTGRICFHNLKNIMIMDSA